MTTNAQQSNQGKATNWWMGLSWPQKEDIFLKYEGEVKFGTIDNGRLLEYYNREHLTQQSDREKALEWWDNLKKEDKKTLCKRYDLLPNYAILAFQKEFMWRKETQVVELKPGMKVSHKYILQPMIIVEDEKGPAYTGEEFADNEISLSFAKMEYSNGNLTILETQPTTDTKEASTGNEVVEQKGQMTGLDWYNAYKESNSLFIKAMEGAVIMKEEHTALYNALTGLYKSVLTCRDNKQALADALFSIKKANPSYSQQDHLTS